MTTNITDVDLDGFDGLDGADLVDEADVDGALDDAGVNQQDIIDEADFFSEDDLGDLGLAIESGDPSQEDIQAFLLEPRVDSANGCPTGFICNGSQMSNCTNIRIVAVLYGFGDVHAGNYCPEGSTRLENCPAGFYCPDPATLEICPKNRYCPHKTEIPEIVCLRCDEGEEVLRRDIYGFAVIVLILVGLFTYAVMLVLKRYRKDLYETFTELGNRQLNPVHHLKFYQEEQARLEKIKPKLFAIAERVKSLRDEQPSNGSSMSRQESSESSTPRFGSSQREPISFGEDGKIRYHPRLLFESLDTSNDNYLNYDELQRVLDLKPEQLSEFVRRMNELGGEKEEKDCVSRPCFVRHFLQVLQESSSFAPTPEEAGALFDELDTEGHGSIKSSSLYTSSLAYFLTDPQINQMIKEFRHSEESHVGGAGGAPTSERSTEEPSSFFFMKERETASRAITRETFSKLYPAILQKVVEEPEAVPLSIRALSVRKDPGTVDLCFQNLCLAVTVGEGHKVNVVNNVSGRVSSGTMTALMGGSGAGKTSLLNALCGRAFYGETTGKTFINGREERIDDHKDLTGFVPQDDIVFAELTVKECLMYSGRFSSPKGTSLSEIEDLADATLANLGLSRVANSIVGDVNRRGVSGGEKKRVNIGVELMSKPACLFLDEPTSGLDSSSALLVMQSLKNLVKKQGVTVISVIHQPRKVIFDLFDSLILLGVGGNLVYHGPVNESEAFFGSIPRPYTLPPGESLADWLIDISTGLIAPDEKEGSNSFSEEGDEIPLHSSIVVREAGPSASATENLIENAKSRREELYKFWTEHFDSLQGSALVRYNPPQPFPFPKPMAKPPFLNQLKIQLERLALLSWRNRETKIVDTCLVVGAVTLVAFFEGVLELTTENIPNISFRTLTNGDPVELVLAFPQLFFYAISNTRVAVQFSMKTGVLTSVLTGLAACKIVTGKRLEFFREAGSGYNIDAYFVAVNIFGFFEHSFQILIAGAVAFWLRSSITSWYSYVFNFWLLMWLTVSWSLLLSIIVPPTSVVLAVTFFCAFFGLLFSGGLPPVVFKDLYNEDSSVVALFSGFFSVTRYFVEAMVVHEQRCLPQQSGFTIHDLTATLPLQIGSFSLLQLAQNDESVVQRSCAGWYWSFWPAFLAGLTIRFLAGGAIHVSNRSKQARVSLTDELKAKPLLKNPAFRDLCIFLFVLLMLFIMSCVLILVERGSSGLPDAFEFLNETSAQQLEDGLAEFLEARAQ